MSEKKRKRKRKKEKKWYLLEPIVVSPREPSLLVEGLELFNCLNRRPVPGRSEISSKATDSGIGYPKRIVEMVV